MPRRVDSGFSLVEVIIACVILALLSSVAMMSVRRAVGGRMLRVLAVNLEREFRQTQTRALAEQCNVALKFSASRSCWTYRMYRDGNGNGVRNADIQSGVDAPIGPERSVWGLGAHIGLPPGPIRDPVSLDWLRAGASPVRFNHSTLCAFSPDGTATPGTLFVTDGSSSAAIVVSGNAGSITVRFYDAARKVWVGSS